jgi:hypothetical protein
MSMSPKEHPALVLSGVMKKVSKRSKIFVNTFSNPVYRIANFRVGG